MDSSDSDDEYRIKPPHLAGLVIVDERHCEEHYAMTLLHGPGCAKGDGFGVVHFFTRGDHTFRGMRQGGSGISRNNRDAPRPYQEEREPRHSADMEA
jgi:hypothetical protein